MPSLVNHVAVIRPAEHRADKYLVFYRRPLGNVTLGVDETVIAHYCVTLEDGEMSYDGTATYYCIRPHDNVMADKALVADDAVLLDDCGIFDVGVLPDD
jgi:hypothetical protein